MTNGNNQPKILPVVDLAELFAMPLTALIEADAQAARTFVDFIKAYGFERPRGSGEDDFGKLKMVSFSYTKIGANGLPQTFNIEIPIILLIPLPALAISDATMKFEVEIFAIVKRNQAVQKALEDGTVPLKHQPVSRRPHQLKVRMARASSGTTPLAGEDKDYAEVKSRTAMQVEVNLRQSDLPEGILQMLNLTAQGTQDTELTIPYFILAARDGKTVLRSQGDTAHINLTFVGTTGTRISDRKVRLEQAPNDLFKMPRRVTTGDDGRASFSVELANLPTTNGKVLQTITAKADAKSEQFGMLSAEGFIRIQVDVETV